MTKAEIVRGIRAERRSTLELLGSLEPSGWDTPTALPGWRVREVAAHLITTDRASLLGLNLLAVLTSMDRLEAWNEGQVPKWAGRPIADLLLGLARWGRRFARLAELLPAPLYRLPVPSAWGRTRGGAILAMRVFDEWVHRQDVRRALGMPDEDVDLTPAAETLLEVIGHDLARWEPTGEGVVEVSLEGVPLPEWRYDLSRRTGWPVDAVAGADADEPRATVRAPGPDFIMAAAGRTPFDELAERGTLTIRGDEHLGRAFLRRVRIV